MLNNICGEIFYYSFIPVFILSIIISILLIIGKKKSDNYYKYNYAIKILISLLIGFVLSLMIGYTVWFLLRQIELETLSQNILLLAVLFVIDISLLLSLIIIFVKFYKGCDKNDEENKKS